MNHVDRASDLPVRWRKSSHSETGSECVELGTTPHWTAIRDSKNPDGGALMFTGTTWAGFRAIVKAGTVDMA